MKDGEFESSAEYNTWRVQRGAPSITASEIQERLLEDLDKRIMSLKPLTWFSFTITPKKKETPMSDAVNRADQVKNDVVQLEKDRDYLRTCNEKLRAEAVNHEQASREIARLRSRIGELDAQISRSHGNGQRMLLVYRDGRIENLPLMADPSQLRTFSKLDAPLYQVTDHWMHYPAPTPLFKRDFIRVHEQAPDAKLIVYIER